MPRPKIYDYDAASDETIVTDGVQGSQLSWIGLNPLTRPDGKEPYMHLVFFEGIIAPSGDALETITRGPTQINIEGQDFTDLYLANKTVFDEFVRLAYEKAAELAGKTGALIES
jgi:hypothetical protein